MIQRAREHEHFYEFIICILRRNHMRVFYMQRESLRPLTYLNETCRVVTEEILKCEALPRGYLQIPFQASFHEFERCNLRSSCFGYLIIDLQRLWRLERIVYSQQRDSLSQTSPQRGNGIHVLALIFVIRIVQMRIEIWDLCQSLPQLYAYLIKRSGRVGSLVNDIVRRDNGSAICSGRWYECGRAGHRG